MICPSCRAQIEDGLNECSYCGYSFIPSHSRQAAGRPSKVDYDLNKRMQDHLERNGHVEAPADGSTGDSIIEATVDRRRIVAPPPAARKAPPAQTPQQTQPTQPAMQPQNPQPPLQVDIAAQKQLPRIAPSQQNMPQKKGIVYGQQQPPAGNTGGHAPLPGQTAGGNAGVSKANYNNANAQRFAQQTGQNPTTPNVVGASDIRQRKRPQTPESRPGAYYTAAVENRTEQQQRQKQKPKEHLSSRELAEQLVGEVMTKLSQPKQPQGAQQGTQPPQGTRQPYTPPQADRLPEKQQTPERPVHAERQAAAKQREQDAYGAELFTEAQLRAQNRPTFGTPPQGQTGQPTPPQPQQAGPQYHIPEPRTDGGTERPVFGRHETGPQAPPQQTRQPQQPVQQPTMQPQQPLQQQPLQQPTRQAQPQQPAQQPAAPTRQEQQPLITPPTFGQDTADEDYGFARSPLAGRFEYTAREEQDEEPADVFAAEEEQYASDDIPDDIEAGKYASPMLGPEIYSSETYVSTDLDDSDENMGPHGDEGAEDIVPPHFDHEADRTGFEPEGDEGAEDIVPEQFRYLPPEEDVYTPAQGTQESYTRSTQETAGSYARTQATPSGYEPAQETAADYTEATPDVFEAEKQALFEQEKQALFEEEKQNAFAEDKQSLFEDEKPNRFAEDSSIAFEDDSSVIFAKDTAEIFSGDRQEEPFAQAADTADIPEPDMFITPDDKHLQELLTESGSDDSLSNFILSEDERYQQEPTQFTMAEDIDPSAPVEDDFSKHHFDQAADSDDAPTQPISHTYHESPLNGQEKKNRRGSWVLLVILGLVLVFAIGYALNVWVTRSYGSFDNMLSGLFGGNTEPQVDLEKSQNEGNSAMTIIVRSKINGELVLENLNKKVPIVNGVAAAIIEDNYWIGARPDDSFTTIKAGPIEMHITDTDGNETPLEPLTYDVAVPATKATVEFEDASRQTHKDTFEIYVVVEPKVLEVSINGVDMKGAVHENKLTYVADLQTIGANSFEIVVRTEYCTSYTETVIINRVEDTGNPSSPLLPSPTGEGETPAASGMPDATTSAPAGSEGQPTTNPDA